MIVWITSVVNGGQGRRFAYSPYGRITSCAIMVIVALEPLSRSLWREVHAMKLAEYKEITHHQCGGAADNVHKAPLKTQQFCGVRP